MGTGILASIPAALLLWYAPQVIPIAAMWLIRGEYRMSPSDLHLGFIFFGIFALLTLPFPIAARYWRRLGSIAAYWTLLIPSAVVCVYLLLMHTVTTVGLVRYVATMGLTSMRFLAGGVAALGYLAVLGSFAWTVWPSRRHGVGEEEREAVPPSTPPS